MKKYSEELPLNARIKIDYRKDKPKVSFKYPSKDLQHSGSMFNYIWITILIICVIFQQGISWNQTVLDFYQKDDLQTFAECVSYHPDEVLTNYSNIINNICKQESNNLENSVNWGLINPMNKGKAGGVIFWILILPLFLSSLIYFPFKKSWNKSYPEFQAIFASKKLAILTSKDVKKNEKGEIYCEIPVFKNVVLDYKATNDFSKYLNLFEIKEHKFEYYYKRPKHPTPKQMKRWKKNKLNEWLWYARFYFSEEPKKGKLEVLFK